MKPVVANPATDLPNNASNRPTNSFHERYASDAEFKRQVDEGRKRAAANQTTQSLKDALATSVNAPESPSKLY